MEREFLVIFIQRGMEKRVTVFARSKDYANEIVKKEYNNIVILKTYNPKEEEIHQRKRTSFYQQRYEEKEKRRRESSIAFWKAIKFIVLVVTFAAIGLTSGVLFGTKIGSLLVSDKEKIKIIASKKKLLHKTYLLAKVVNENKGISIDGVKDNIYGDIYGNGLFVYPGTFKSFSNSWVINGDIKCFPLLNIKITRNLKDLINVEK